jgi:hypothetical protein
MAVPYTFGSATSSIPLSQLDSNFATAITLGNTAVYLGNTTTTLNGLTLSNVTISSGNVTITSVTLTNANITGTTTLSNLTASTALALDSSKNIVSVTNTGTGNNVLAASPSLTGTVTIATLNLTNALGTTYGGTGLTSFTSSGVVYASSSSALATGSALTWNGTQLGIGTSSPTSGYALDVRDRARVASTSNYVLDLIGSGANASTIQFYADNSIGAIIATGSSAIPLTFYTNGSEQMRLTSTGLGIGTSSPAYKLDVNGSAQLRGAGYLYFGNSDGTNSFYINNAGATGGNNASLVFNETNYGAVMTIQNGNLGLGVTPSAWATVIPVLELKNGVHFGALSTGTPIGYLGANAYYNGTNWIYKVSSNYANRYELNSGGAGAHAWFNAGTGTAGNAITFTQAMTLDASGRLGIGNTSPSERLSVGSVSDASNFLRINSSTVQTVFGSDANGGYVGTDNSYALRLFTNNTERARIDSSGRFLVGTTSAYPSGSGLTMSTTGYWASHATGTSSGTQYVGFDYAGVTIGSITQSGTTAVLYNVTSDQRLKENIVDAPEFGSVIDSIKVRSYDWKADGNHQRAGFIAQELVTVAPEAVHQPADQDEMMAVDYSKLVPMLVKEIQSLRKRLADAGIA